jgi:DNA-binding transcriptional ArsR family regulator
MANYINSAAHYQGMKENFLLISLKEDESKQLAQVISNRTSRKILDLLAEKSHTETDIAKKLNLPLSTVHYNMQALVRAKLVTADEYHYSKKGKEVNHYSLANKYVIIAPQDAPSNLRERLRRILPAGLIAVAGAGLIQLYNMFFSAASQAEPMLMESPEAAETIRALDSVAAEKAGGIVISQPNIALWFLLGAVFAIIVFVVVEWIAQRK